MTTLGRVQHGSRLYGLSTPTSDWDEKAIHLPPLDDCLLLRATKNAHFKGEKDGAKLERESFALQSFLDLAANAEDVALTVLHAGPEHILEDSPYLAKLRVNRSRFYTKGMRGAAGYALSQSAKYALRADRMAAVERVIAALEIAEAKGVARLYQCWDDLPRGEHIEEVVSDNNRDALDKRILEVAGKGLPATVAPGYAKEILIRMRDAYGERVKAAKAMDGRDLKSMTHAFRVCYQLIHVYEDGGFSFPLPETEFLMAVKTGKVRYVDDRLDERLNDLMARVERLAEASTYPEKADRAFCDELILEAYACYEIAPITKAAMLKAAKSPAMMALYETMTEGGIPAVEAADFAAAMERAKRHTPEELHAITERRLAKLRESTF